MRLYNTHSRTIESFQPTAPVTVYVCGITPYDTTHLGHAFTYVVFDILIRTLEYQGHPVRYVQNVTDIDDDILRKARETDDDWLALGNRWTTHFIEDLQALNVRPPDFFPRATDVIAEIITAVEDLLALGVAYEVDGNVYYHVDSWQGFGGLNRLPSDQMLAIANERGNIPDDPHKRDPLDFVLWQAQKPGEPAWESPWGLGRPGWHIECSTMVSKYLGQSIDIHGGGGDLAFPHHECERAQIEPVTGEPFVRIWMHAAMVYHEGAKMSKSLGNLVMARDLLKVCSPDGLRLYLACHHYRNSWTYDPHRLAEAEMLAARLRRTATMPSGSGPPFDTSRQRQSFMDALVNDLDTPSAIRILDQLSVSLVTAALEGQDIRKGQKVLDRLGELLGLRLAADQPEASVIAGWDAHKRRFLQA